ncbi:family 78 glycoside hydrolase catalytic domain [Pelagicoccus sp. SDUM812005]|uniref:family 78 glycoside hydrolase catalytic domain n=1 Tax=Pelagicoccus sp. SDUM812005 TaxID=3041257 RepID=UPI00280DC402|nr:family 78 glycoside hydrolase catalytic domain [Pelagicoccus sp. SDUM812005]MDQ8179604.1 family 78 glycoside hydrolase catalytic domain [Pelagicoccus sp. SDUM812005]
MLKKLLALSLLIVPQLFAAPAATSLRVGPLLENPIGYGERDLQFSWQLPEGRQIAWEVRCSSSAEDLPGKADLWSSGRRDSDQSLFVDYEGAVLDSRDQLYWTVRYWNEANEVSPWAPVSKVELGLLHATDWEGQWISHRDHPAGEAWYAPHFRKDFQVGKSLKQARLYFAAEGIVDFSINGQAVSDHYFAPGWPDYRKRRLARVVDVTSLLERGENAIGAVLADGWFSGTLLFSKRDRNGGVPALLCQLELSYEDGSRYVLASDGSWKVATGPVVSADFYDGERYDARLELGAWDEAGYDASGWGWPQAREVDRELPINSYAGPAVKVVERIAPVSWSRSATGSIVYDFGVNLVGVPRIALPLREGQQIELKFAEALDPDGSPHYENLRSAEATDRYVAASSGLAEWSPRFSFHGYRYLELIGMPEELAPQADWVESLVLSSEVPSTGEFSSSVDDWNQLQRNIRRSQLGNFLEVPTDCPQRNERLGWTGDIQVFGPTASFNYQSLAFLEKWCRDLRDGQYASGKIPDVAPDVMERVRPTGTPAWGDAIAIVPWDMYQKYGYKKILRDNYQSMIAWVAYYDLETAANDGLWIDYGYSDWLQPFQENTERPLRGDTSRSLLGTAYYARSAAILAWTAEALGESHDATLFAKRAEAVRDRFAEAFFEGGILKPREDGQPTQTAYLLALAFDLLPEEDRPVALGELERLIVEEAGGHLRTGFVGTALICRTLTRFGRSDLAYEVALKEEYPSWIYSIRQGATSIWERWNSYSQEEGFNGAKMNSLNHYAYGAVGQWLYESVAGLSEAAPGYRKLRVAPQVGGGLSSASAKLDTPYGLAESSWEVKEGRFSLLVRVPPNTSASVELPDGGSREVGPGEHAFSCEL